MYVCICLAIREETVKDAIRSGARNAEEISSACGAGSDCGSCRFRLEKMIDAPREDTEPGAGQASA